MLTSLEEQYELEFRIHTMIPMRDDVHLSTDLYIPKGLGPWPVILTRTPYGNSDAERLRIFDMASWMRDRASISIASSGFRWALSIRSAA